MAWQLVYTSAPGLLEAGRTGFGTVAKHDAIRPGLQTELERISQFSREQGLSKDRILFYHRVLELRGERYHILSRIRDAGSDYTGRTNHIAHHLVLTAAEAEVCFKASHCTPADILLWITSQRDIWRDRWDEPARHFSAADEIATANIPSGIKLPAAEWESVTGLKANAAILAPGSAAAEGCWLLYPENRSAQLLPLIGESLCLHPSPWGVSFASDTQPTDRIEELRWRGVALGSPLERTARQSVRPVLDLGNPASLPSPVESAAHLAETGLMKAPAPISTRITREEPGVISAEQAFTKTANFSTTGSVGSAVGGAASLKDKMKGVATPTRKPIRKGLPVQGIAVGIAVAFLLLLAAVVGNQCILPESQISKLISNTRIIIYNLTDGKGQLIDDKWRETLVEQSILVSDYRIVAFGTKSEFREAQEKIDSLSRLKGNELKLEWTAIKQRSNNQLLDSVFKKIDDSKKTSDKEAQAIAEAARRRDAERADKEAALAKERADKEAALAKERADKEAALAKAKTTTALQPPRIVNIAFWQLSEKEGNTAHKKFFPGGNLSPQGAVWSQKNNLTNTINYIQGLESSTNWERDPVTVHITDFNNEYNNSEISSFATRDTNNQINVTIVYKNSMVETNHVASGAFSANKNDQGNYTLKIAQEIDNLIKTAVNTGAQCRFTIQKGDDIAPWGKMKLTSHSLEELEASINERLSKINKDLSEMERPSPTTFKKPVEKNDESADLKSNRALLFDAGKNIYIGLTVINTNKPITILNYSEWIKETPKSNDQTNSPESYKKYLQYVFGNMDKYLNSSNSGQSGTFNNLKGSQCLNDGVPITTCFKKIHEKCTDFNKCFDNTSNYGTGSGAKKLNDQKLVANMENIFSINPQMLLKIFPPLIALPPDPKIALTNELGEIQSILADLNKGNFKTYSPRIELLDGTNINPILIFTTP